MFLYLFMYSLQHGIGKQILAVFDSKGKCMSFTLCQSYFFKYKLQDDKVASDRKPFTLV